MVQNHSSPSKQSLKLDGLELSENKWIEEAANGKHTKDYTINKLLKEKYPAVYKQASWYYLLSSHFAILLLQFQSFQK